MLIDRLIRSVKNKLFIHPGHTPGSNYAYFQAQEIATSSLKKTIQRDMRKIHPCMPLFTIRGRRGPSRQLQW